MKVPSIKSSESEPKPSKKIFGVLVLLGLFVMAAIGGNHQSSNQTPTATSSGSAQVSSGVLLPDGDLNKMGMEKLAEMTALARHSETCPEVPREWSAAFVVLIMATPPTEELVEAQERKMLALRDEIGEERWCQLHSVEMKEAYLIYQFIARH